MSSVLFGELRSVSSKHSFQNASGTTNVVLDSSGRLGVGTTSPSSTFHCQGSALVTGTLTTSNLSVLGTTTTINAYETVSSNVVINNTSGVGPALRVAQTGSGAGYPVADFYDNDVSTSVPALRIADGGNVGVGTATALQKLHINGLLRADYIQSAKTVAYQWVSGTKYDLNAYSWSSSWTFTNLGGQSITSTSTYSGSSLIAPYTGMYLVTLRFINGHSYAVLNYTLGAETGQINANNSYNLDLPRVVYATSGSQLLSGAGNVTGQLTNYAANGCNYQVIIRLIQELP
jgi:hypothetical protein